MVYTVYIVCLFACLLVYIAYSLYNVYIVYNVRIVYIVYTVYTIYTLYTQYSLILLDLCPFLVEPSDVRRHPTTHAPSTSSSVRQTESGDDCPAMAASMPPMAAQTATCIAPSRTQPPT